jgi:hypothetical protein
MLLVEIDRARPQLLRLTLSDRVDSEEAAAGYDSLKKLLPDLSPGFCLLTDMTRLETMDLACEPIIDQVMDACNRAGVQKVVRIVPEPNKDIGFGIMSLFHYGHNVRIVTCSTAEEADAALDSRPPVGST